MYLWQITVYRDILTWRKMQIFNQMNIEYLILVYTYTHRPIIILMCVRSFWIKKIRNTRKKNRSCCRLNRSFSLLFDVICLCNENLVSVNVCAYYSDPITHVDEFILCSECSNQRAFTVFFISITFMGIYLAFHDGALSIKSLAHSCTPIKCYLPVSMYSSKIRLGANWCLQYWPLASYSNAIEIGICFAFDHVCIGASIVLCCRRSLSFSLLLYTVPVRINESNGSDVCVSVFESRAAHSHIRVPKKKREKKYLFCGQKVGLTYFLLYDSI